jgi:hypothetical protein
VPGSDLTIQDYTELEARWIDRTLAIQAGFRRVDSITGAEIVGRKGGNYSGIVIPYFRPGSGHAREHRLRRDHPDLEYDPAGNLKPRQKYLSPPGRSNMLYVVPGVDPGLFHDMNIPVVLTEGEFKALALWRLANHGSPAWPKFLPLGLSGVYNWRGTIGKTVGPDGSRLDVKGVIPDLDCVAWQDRKVVIAYDADAVMKAPVRIARSELAAHLRGRGALVGFLEWDLATGKGIDDHLAVAGPDRVLDEISHVDFASSAWRMDLLRGKGREELQVLQRPTVRRENAGTREVISVSAGPRHCLCVDDKARCRRSTVRSRFCRWPWVYRRDSRMNERHESRLCGSDGCASGMTVSSCCRRHQEFLRFLNDIDANLPGGFDVHLVMDNYGTHEVSKVRTWLARPSRYPVHFTATTASCLNLVERLFAEVTERRVWRGSHTGVRALEKAMLDYLDQRNRDPTLFVWTPDADLMLGKAETLQMDL